MAPVSRWLSDPVGVVLVAVFLVFVIGLAETIRDEVALWLTREARQAFDPARYRPDLEFTQALIHRSWLAGAFALRWDCPKCGNPVRRFFEEVSDYTKTPQYDSIHSQQFVYYCDSCRVYGVDVRRTWMTGGPPMAG